MNMIDIDNKLSDALRISKYLFFKDDLNRPP